MQVHELSSFEKATAVWDLIIKGLGWAATVVVGWFSLWKYRQQRAKEARDYQDQKQRELAQADNQKKQELEQKQREFAQAENQRKQELEQRAREVSQAHEQKQRELEQRAQELKVKVFERELEFYSQATTAASKIAFAAANGQRDEAAEREFWELYWGPLCMVETPDVAQAMVNFGDAIGAPDQDLSELSYQLAQATRKAVEEKFQVELGTASARPRRRS